MTSTAHDVSIKRLFFCLCFLQVQLLSFASVDQHNTMDYTNEILFQTAGKPWEILLYIYKEISKSWEILLYIFSQSCEFRLV